MLDDRRRRTHELHVPVVGEVLVAQDVEIAGGLTPGQIMGDAEKLLDDGVQRRFTARTDRGKMASNGERRSGRNLVRRADRIQYVEHLGHHRELRNHRPRAVERCDSVEQFVDHAPSVPRRGSRYDRRSSRV